MTTAVVFVYGSGREPVVAIDEARALGMRVVACGGDPGIPAMRTADVTHLVDLRDPEAVVTALRATPPDVVLPTPYGPFVPTVGAVTDAFGLPGAGRAVSALCHDKRAFNQVLQRAGLPTPRQHVAVSGRQIRAAIRRTGVPCIIKPREGVGSRGVQVIQSEADIARSISWHLAERHAFGYTDTVVEQYILGSEYAINMVIGADGRPVFAQVHTKEMSPLPLRQEFGKYIDPATDRDTIEAIEEAMASVASHLGLRLCFVNGDVIVTPDRSVHIVDFTPRIGGPWLGPALIPAASGVNVTCESLRLFTGQGGDFTRTASNAAVLRYYPPAESGIVMTDPDVARAASMPGVVHAYCALRAGTRLNGWQRTAELRTRALVITNGSTLADAEVAWLDATAALGLRVGDDVAAADVMHALARSEVRELQ